MKRLIITILLAILILATNVYALTCDATPASMTVDLGSSKKVTISCSDWGSVTSVTVEATQYNANCLSLDKTSDTITPSTTKDFTITATSMACNPYIDDRTIIWKFTPNTGSAPPSKSTVVSIQSGLTISTTFKQAPYSATPGGEVTIILEVSTTANEDINNIEIDTSGSDSALISAGFTDKSISKIAASQGEKTQQVSWVINAPSTAGTYTLRAVVTSQNADSDTATATLTVSQAAPPSEERVGGGGGGAVGGGAPEEISIQRSKGKVNITIPLILPGRRANVTIEKTEDMAITFLSIQVNNSVNNVRINIIKLPGKPAYVVHELKGKVYHYIEINKSDIRDEDINKTLIRFRVEKSWINANNINESTIALNRYTADGWKRLPTIKISEDGENVYFEAEFSGLSLFAITGEEKVTVAPPAKECPPCPQPSAWSECIEGKQTRTNYRCSAETNYECVPYTEERACEAAKPGIPLELIITIILIITCIIGGICGFIYLFRMKWI